MNVPIEETIEALEQVVKDGKARFLGFSEWTPEQIQAAIDISGPDLFASSQPQYSMLWQAPEAELFPICAANDISHIVWSPLAQGVLTGKYKPGQPHPEDSRAANDAMSQAMHLVMNDKSLEAVQRLIPIADSAGLTLPSWRSPGCCVAPRWPRRSSAPRVPSRSTRTRQRLGSSCQLTYSPRSMRRSATPRSKSRRWQRSRSRASNTASCLVIRGVAWCATPPS